jgi:hypothetical protein
MAESITLNTTDPDVTAAQETATAEALAVGEQLAQTNSGENIERPDWLPEKFNSPEEMATAYKEAEQKISQGQQGESTNTPEPIKTPESTDEAQSTLEAAGVDFNNLTTEFTENGELSEATFETLNKAGFPKEVVDSFIAGQQALADNINAAAYNAAGSESEYNIMSEWAAENLTEAEIASFNNSLDGTKEDMVQAITALKSRYSSDVGSDGLRHNQTTGSTSGDAYESWAQVQVDMNDPRYATDPAFRSKVSAKLGRSNV